jgi:acyl-CoA thioester hydrolase
MSQRSAPLSGEFRYSHPIEVRYNDTDALGHINNATYLTYFEAARAGYYEQLLGRPFGTGDGADLHTFLIAEAVVRYRKPGFFGERLTVDCRVSWASRSSFGLEYRVRSLGSTLAPARILAEGDTVQVMFDLKSQRVTRVPAELRQHFEEFEDRPIPGVRPG